MNLTVFQRLTLIALATIIRSISGRTSFYNLLRTVAYGHHTDDQQKSLLSEWRMGNPNE